MMYGEALNKAKKWRKALEDNEPLEGMSLEQTKQFLDVIIFLLEKADK